MFVWLEGKMADMNSQGMILSICNPVIHVCLVKELETRDGQLGCC